MYHAYFGLKDEPFGVTPDGRFFLETEQHREAVSTLYYGIKQRRGFMLLLGAAGLGKTSCLIKVLDRVRGQAETAFIPHTFFESGTVLESILTALGLESGISRAQNHRLFYEYLTKSNRTGKTCVVIFDEAQNLTRETIEDIRMLSNFETQTEKLVQIVLAGQLALADALRRPDYEQVRQRLSLVSKLRPLDGREAINYIAHRLRVASLPDRDVRPESLFTETALQAIVIGSGGVPRNVNTICFNSLSLAFALSRRRVGSDEVLEAIQDLNFSSGDGTLPAPSMTPEASGTAMTNETWPQTEASAFKVAMNAGSQWIRNLFPTN